MRGTAPRPASLREVRIWLRDHDFDVGERGPLPKHLLDEFTRQTGRPIGRPVQPETR